MSTLLPDRYSARVEAHIVVDDQRYSVARISSFDATIRDHCDIPAKSMAKLVITIDGKSEEFDIFLPQRIEGPGDFIYL